MSGNICHLFSTYCLHCERKREKGTIISSLIKYFVQHVTMFSIF